MKIGHTPHRRRIALCAAVTIAAAAAPPSLRAQATAPATRSTTTRPVIDADLTNTEVIPLWPASKLADAPAGDTETITDRVDPVSGRRDRRVTLISRPTITRFAVNDPEPRIAVVVIPGGGYSGEVIDREGYFIAQALRAAGFAPFVLKYRLPTGTAPKDGESPLPLVDVQRAIRLIRANAGAWGVDANRVGVMGFSAGGHVAGMAATQFEVATADADDAVEKQPARPDFAVLMYAVSSMDESIAHAGSRKRLIGDAPDASLVERFSTAKRITQRTPPLFVVHAKDDRVVKVENSDEIAAAANAHGVPCEYVKFETGGHGFGLANPGAEPFGWIDRFRAWVTKP